MRTVTLKEWVEAADKIIWLADFGASLTETTVDDEAIAQLKTWRDRLKPVLGAGDDSPESPEIRESVEVPEELRAPLMAAKITPETWAKIEQVLALIIKLAPLFIK